MEGLIKGLGDGAYDTWTRERLIGKECFRRAVKFVGVENSISEEDRLGSGLVKLEEIVKNAAYEIVGCRDFVPARWVAFVEKLEREVERKQGVFLTKGEAEWVVKDFPAFSKMKEEREREALEALQSNRGVGRVVVFEMKDRGEYFVFMKPEKILEFVRAVTGPRRSVQRHLKRCDAIIVESGLLTEEGLDVV